MDLYGLTKLVIFLLALILVGESTDQPLEERERDAVQFMKSLNDELNRMINLATEAEWAFQSNLTDENESKANKVAAEYAKFIKKKGKELQKFDFRNFKDKNLKRQFKKLSKLGYAALSDKEFKELRNVLSKMESNYSKVKVCSYTVRTKCNLALNPDIEDIISKSRDPDELKYYWKEWYDKAGAPVRKYFDKYVELNEKAARLNNFRSGADAWLAEYDDDTFEQQIENIFDQLRPLYEQLHGYVRWRLNKYYGNDIVSEKGPIPMHLLGNLWAQTWEDIASIVQPFPDKPLLDVSDEMIKQGYTTLKMFQMADGFFASMNMSKVPHTFWAKSIIEKPNDRQMVCHASAWDFFKIDDVRIKMCTKVNMGDFFTIHHELGHIQYYLQYQHLPSVYRRGANPGFHEAVGDVLSLSVSTPKHLEAIGLLKNYKPDKESRLNQLFLQALSKIVFLPFSFTLDKYRWGIFRGEIKPAEYNCAFWKLREQYSGIEPPVQRTENDFDAAAKYHISSNVEYLRYLVSYIIQFQFYKTACEKAGQYVPNDPMLPLENCDIYGSAAAGNAFKAMLSLGASKPWPDALEVFTGERKMTANAIMEYFKPLKIWLEEKNKKNNVYIGWEPSTKCVYNNGSYVKILPKFTLVLSNYWLLSKSSMSK